MTNLHTFHSLVRNWFSPAPAILALAVLATACGGEDDRPAPLAVVETETTPEEKKEDSTSTPPKKPECEEGDAKECRITLPKQGSVQNCIDGVRYCEKGFWGPCEVHD